MLNASHLRDGDDLSLLLSAVSRALVVVFFLSTYFQRKWFSNIKKFKLLYRK